MSHATFSATTCVNDFCVPEVPIHLFLSFVHPFHTFSHLLRSLWSPVPVAPALQATLRQWLA